MEPKSNKSQNNKNKIGKKSCFQRSFSQTARGQAKSSASPQFVFADLSLLVHRRRRISGNFWRASQVPSFLCVRVRVWSPTEILIFVHNLLRLFWWWFGSRIWNLKFSGKICVFLCGLRMEISVNENSSFESQWKQFDSDPELVIWVQLDQLLRITAFIRTHRIVLETVESIFCFFFCES